METWEQRVDGSLPRHFARFQCMATAYLIIKQNIGIAISSYVCIKH